MKTMIQNLLLIILTFHYLSSVACVAQDDDVSSGDTEVLSAQESLVRQTIFPSSNISLGSIGRIVLSQESRAPEDDFGDNNIRKNNSFTHHKSVEHVFASLLRVTHDHLSPVSVNKDISSSSSSSFSSSSPLDLETHETQTLTTEQKWVSSVKVLSSLMESSMKSLIPFVLHHVLYENTLSPVCSSSLSKLVSGLRSNKAWAYSCKHLHAFFFFYSVSPDSPDTSSWYLFFHPLLSSPLFSSPWILSLFVYSGYFFHSFIDWCPWSILTMFILSIFCSLMFFLIVFLPFSFSCPFFTSLFI